MTFQLSNGAWASDASIEPDWGSVFEHTSETPQGFTVVTCQNPQCRPLGRPRVLFCNRLEEESETCKCGWKFARKRGKERVVIRIDPAARERARVAAEAELSARRALGRSTSRSARTPSAPP